MASCINIDQLKRVHATFKDAHRRAVKQELENAGHEELQWVQAHPGFKPCTNKLQGATRAQVIARAAGGILRLSNALNYAASIENGARPHPIVARFAPLLVFFWQKVGRWMFVKRVSHPGNKPYNFLKRARSAGAASFRQRMLARMAALAKRF